jgi:hypothetical protein
MTVTADGITRLAAIPCPPVDYLGAQNLDLCTKAWRNV